MQQTKAGMTSNFKALYHNAPCGLITFQLDGTILYLNETLLSWLGLPQHEIVKKRFSDLLDQGGKIYYQLFIHPLLTMQKEVKEINLQVMGTDGNFQVLFNASVCEVIAGKQAIVNATIFKINDRQKYEDELLKKKKQAEEETERQSHALNEIAFDQAHLVRAPLANILGLVAMLSQMELETDIKDLVVMLKESADMLDDVVTQIVNKTNH